MWGITWNIQLAFQRLCLEVIPYVSYTLKSYTTRGLYFRPVRIPFYIYWSGIYWVLAEHGNSSHDGWCKEPLKNILVLIKTRIQKIQDIKKILNKDYSAFKEPCSWSR